MYQAFWPDLGWASQHHETKVNQEMFPKYRSNPLRRKTWEMESGIAALQHEPVSPEEGELDCSHFLWGTLRKLWEYRSRVPRQMRYIPQKSFEWALTLASSHTERSAKFLSLSCCLLGLKFDISKSTSVKWTLCKKEQKEDKSWHLKHWHWRQTLPERSIWQAEQLSPPFPTRLWGGHWQWGIGTGKG